MTISRNFHANWVQRWDLFQQVIKIIISVIKEICHPGNMEINIYFVPISCLAFWWSYFIKLLDAGLQRKFSRTFNWGCRRGWARLGTSKNETPMKVNALYGMKKYVNKICLPSLVPEIELFVYILIKNPKWPRWPQNGFWWIFNRGSSSYSSNLSCNLINLIWE